MQMGYVTVRWLPAHPCLIAKEGLHTCLVSADTTQVRPCFDSELAGCMHAPEMFGNLTGC